jgi:hypothetical protein
MKKLNFGGPCTSLVAVLSQSEMLLPIDVDGCIFFLVASRSGPSHRGRTRARLEAPGQLLGAKADAITRLWLAMLSYSTVSTCNAYVTGWLLDASRTAT